MRAHKDLVVWQKSVDLSVAIYKETDHFPKSEIYGVTSQIRRAVVAVPSNIAEGQLRGHKKEYVQFIRIALGSAAELETQLLIASRIGYLQVEAYEALATQLVEIMKMLNRLLSYLLTSKI